MSSSGTVADFSRINAVEHGEHADRQQHRDGERHTERGAELADGASGGGAVGVVAVGVVAGARGGIGSGTSVLEPVADGFRNYLKGRSAVPAEHLLVDRAQLLTEACACYFQDRQIYSEIMEGD